MKSVRLRVLLAAAGCIALLLSAVGWVSLTVLDLDRSERAVRAQAAVEENVRLALWRMDSSVAPIVAREGARSVTDYRRTMNSGAFVQVNFQFDSEGALSSPQGESETLRAFAKVVSREQLIAALAAERYSQELLLASAADTHRQAVSSGEPQRAQRVAERANDDERQVQMQKSSNEFVQRSWSIGNAYNNGSFGSVGAPVDGLELSADGNTVAFEALREKLALVESAPAHPMTPLWIGEQLLVARRVNIDGREWIQGAWLDWASLRTQLLSAIADLLPNAELLAQPVAARSDSVDPSRTLVSLPARVVPGALAGVPTSQTPVGWILLVVWCAVLLAAGAAVALIVGISALSERRAAFVAAVTHELRTPLTTLQTYSEMLADGKVRDESKQNRYVRTLHREAVRLGHLVENVLSYSRIERGRGGLRKDEVGARKLLERTEQRLVERAQGAQMELVLQVPEADELRFVGDGPAVEQIVFNLVDNASKYGAGDERRIEVKAARADGAISISVRDFGSGVPADVRKRLFQPFSKSVERAATSAPGVGLGLALSRRLARSMGGRLSLDSSVEVGSRFVLELPELR